MCAPVSGLAVQVEDGCMIVTEQFITAGPCLRPRPGYTPHPQLLPRLAHGDWVLPRPGQLKPGGVLQLARVLRIVRGEEHQLGLQYHRHDASCHMSQIKYSSPGATGTIWIRRGVRKRVDKLSAWNILSTGGTIGEFFVFLIMTFWDIVISCCT